MWIGAMGEFGSVVMMQWVRVILPAGHRIASQRPATPTISPSFREIVKSPVEQPIERRW
jgi:hypothetical protein